MITKAIVSKWTLLVLSLSLGALTAIALDNRTPARAWLGCSSLKGCTGSGGCNDANSNGCDLSCADGTKVSCPKSQ
jgi:hypothetical protein